MGRGSSGRTLGNANEFLGRNGRVPSEDEIRMGNARYGGLPVLYDARLRADAENMTTEIHVSDKFFEHDVDTQRHILNHEVAHNYSDDMISANVGRYSTFARAFLQERPVPEGSPAWQRGQRMYTYGLYGDIGATALVETTTRAITEYLNNPEALKNRSIAAYREIRRFMRRYTR